MLRLVAAGAALVGVLAGAGYLPPVDAPVVDPFRPPSTPFSSGNRGLEYETVPGQAVGAVGAGEVVFAGRVGPSRHVTILHPDGLRSSYSYLDEILVVVGQQVSTGDSVGRAGPRLHLGIRAGSAYLDPAALFAAAAATPRLVPVR